MASHAPQGTAAPADRGGRVRAKILTPQPFSAERLSSDPLALAAATEQAALLLSDVLRRCGVSQERFARATGQSTSRLRRKLDPDDVASLTVRDLLVARLYEPRVYHELVRALAELDVGDGEAQQPQGRHLRLVVAAVGRASALTPAEGADALTARLRRDLDRSWAELEHLVRQARRDLRRGAR